MNAQLGDSLRHRVDYLYADHLQLHLLHQLAHMRAALFRFDPPLDFSIKYLHDRIFNFKPASFSVPVAPTREFWIHVVEAKIKATIKNEGDMIGWEDDNETVGPKALAAKQSLLRAIPYLMPPENASKSLYRFTLEHGDFGIHNTSIADDASGRPLVTSLYDWETACIAPALLSDPLVAAGPVDLIIDGEGRPAVTRIPKEATASDLEGYAMWAQHYIKVRHFLVCHGSNDRLTGAIPSPRYFTKRRRSTRLPSEPEGTYATFGSHCGTGMEASRKNFSVRWELGQRNECRRGSLWRLRTELFVLWAFISTVFFPERAHTREGAYAGRGIHKKSYG